MNSFGKSLLLLLMIIPSVVLAGQGRGYLEIGGGYKTGDFGTPDRFNLYYFSPALGYVTSR